jgi:GMP synthase (glutamine-hydrolysing)
VNRPRVLVVQHNLDDHMNELAGPLVEAGIRIDTWCTWISAVAPEPLDSYDGILSMGALASVTEEDDHLWISAERELLEDALRFHVPVLGVCFGAQLLARAAGADVYRAAEPEIGWSLVEMTPEALEDPLFAGLGSSFHAFQFHYDTFSAPDDATVFSRSGDVIQAYRIGALAWGVQFHAEANPGTIHSWLGTYKDAMDEAHVDVESVMTLTADHAATYRNLGRGIASAFAAEVLDHQARRQSSDAAMREPLTLTTTGSNASA